MGSASQPGFFRLPETLPLPFPELCAFRSRGPAPAVGQASSGQAYSPQETRSRLTSAVPLWPGLRGFGVFCCFFFNFQRVHPAAGRRARGGGGAVRASLRPAAGAGKGSALPRLPGACTGSAEERPPSERHRFHRTRLLFCKPSLQALT